MQPLHDSVPGAGKAGALDPATSPGWLADWASLTKPRIGGFVLLAAFTGGLLSSGGTASMATVFTAAVLVALTAASACVFNQVLERDVDRLMERTAGRPLPAGRLRSRDAILFGAALGVIGVAGLALTFNLLAALLGLSTLVAYALVYTPLKRHSSLNTVIGALPGAMPPLLGAIAVAGSPGTWGWMLFAILFAWQFPHFMAIAWLYREDYRRAGMKMLPALPGSEGLAGLNAVLYSLVLLPLALLPFMRGEAGPVYALGALLLGIAYAVASFAFARRECRSRARWLLLTSLFYLPLLLTLALADPLAGQVF